jgi:putative tryptophan/tyrosine transport system substrate-binding protein
MLRKNLPAFIVILMILCRAADGFPHEILVVQDLKIKPYNDALSGFKTALNDKVANANYTVRDSGEAVAFIKERRPDLILAIGMDAFHRVKKFSNEIPMVYLMVLNPTGATQEDRIITGVGMTIAPEKQLAAMRLVLPGARRIGLVYDPRKSGPFVRRAQAAAKEFRFDLISKEVSHPRFVSNALNSMKGAVDVLWMIPDTTVITPDTVELIMLHSLDNRLPVCTFSIKYLEMGALMSLDINAVSMGRQAGEQAAGILSGTDLRDVRPVDADNPTLIINDAVARKLRIHLGEDLRNKARIIR